jgi:hypothetical protein
MTRTSVGLAVALLLAGCSDPLDFCQSCLKGDPALAVPKGDIAKIGLVYSGQKLPPSATNVYYHEECGIDCQQWIRFDAPVTDARAFANSLLLAPLAKPAPQPPQSSQFLLPTKPLQWWPKAFPDGVETGTNDINDANYKDGAKGKPMTIILQPGSPNARVWIYAFSM